jgi:hypothetical protein
MVTAESAEQVGINGAKAQLTAAGTGAFRVVLVQQPPRFGGREHRVQRQTAELPDPLTDTGIKQVLAGPSGPLVLPADHRADRFPAGPFPEQQRFPLGAQPDRDHHGGIVPSQGGIN